MWPSSGASNILELCLCCGCVEKTILLLEIGWYPTTVLENWAILTGDIKMSKRQKRQELRKKYHKVLIRAYTSEHIQNESERLKDHMFEDARNPAKHPWFVQIAKPVAGAMYRKARALRHDAQIFPTDLAGWKPWGCSPLWMFRSRWVRWRCL